MASNAHDNVAPKNAILPLPPALAAAVDAAGTAKFFHYKGTLYAPIHQGLSDLVFPTGATSISGKAQKFEAIPRVTEDERDRDVQRDARIRNNNNDVVDKGEDEDVVFISDSRYVHVP